MRKENARLKKENEILKKAMAIVCSEETGYSVSCCIKDEGRHLKTSMQVGMSYYLKVLLSKVMVVNV